MLIIDLGGDILYPRSGAKTYTFLLAIFLP
jgi:hypothetical protein